MKKGRKRKMWIRFWTNTHPAFYLNRVPCRTRLSSWMTSRKRARVRVRLSLLLNLFLPLLLLLLRGLLWVLLRLPILSLLNLLLCPLPLNTACSSCGSSSGSCSSSWHGTSTNLSIVPSSQVPLSQVTPPRPPTPQISPPQPSPTP